MWKKGKGFGKKERIWKGKDMEGEDVEKGKDVEKNERKGKDVEKRKGCGKK